MRLRAPRDSAAIAFDEAGVPSPGTPWSEAGWCAIDLELTGLRPRKNDIIAIGAIPIEGGKVLLGESLYTLVRTTRRSEHGAVLVHKLRVADLADAPPLEDALDLLLGTLGGRIPVFHTARVETSFLAPLFSRRRVKLPAPADTEVLGREWLARRDGQAPSYVTLERLAVELGQPVQLGQSLDHRHRGVPARLPTQIGFVERRLVEPLDPHRPEHHLPVGPGPGAAQLAGAARRAHLAQAGAGPGGP